MKKELEKNVESNGSDTSGSVGSDSGSTDGSAGNGSNSGINGSGGNTDGNDRSASGNGSGSGSADFGSSGSDNTSESIGTNDSNVESVDSDRNNADGNGKRRRSAGKPIRLGSFGNRDTDSSADSGSGSDDGEERVRRDNSEPVVRLGSKSKDRPKTDTKSEGAETVFEIGKTKDLIKVFLNSVFEIPAITLKQDFWRLSKDESVMLTDALIDYLKSMPKSKASRLAQFLSENLPLVNLAMIAFFIVSERVRATMAISQVTNAAKNYEKQAKAAQNITPTDSGIKTPLDALHNVH